MAKDPAFLFYPNDWIGGTMGMSFEEKGAYMELLMMQFNRGHMTYDMMGQTVGRVLDKVLDKFVKDEKGLYYNVRLEEEKNKRKRFVDSRLNNKKGKNQHTKNGGHTSGHMTSHMEDENIVNTIDNNKVIKEEESNSENQKKVDFSMIEIYYKGWEAYRGVMNGQARHLTEEIFDEWKYFVDFVYEKKFDELFICKFINPVDFAKLLKENDFPRNRWETVLRKILATGVKPEHNLYFRIPEFISYDKHRNTERKSRSDKQAEQYAFIKQQTDESAKELGLVGSRRI